MITLINEKKLFCFSRIGLLSTFYETRWQPTENQTTKGTNANLLLTTYYKGEKKGENQHCSLPPTHIHTHFLSLSLTLFSLSFPVTNISFSLSCVFQESFHLFIVSCTLYIWFIHAICSYFLFLIKSSLLFIMPSVFNKIGFFRVYGHCIIKGL